MMMLLICEGDARELHGLEISCPTRRSSDLETSTGVRSDIAPLGAGKGDALLLMDCVTSVGGIDVQVDGWGVDLAYSGTQKCLGVAPGLAPVTVSRSEEHPSELQSLMRISYAVFCLTKKRRTRVETTQ